MRQPRCASTESALKKKRARREKFLAEMWWRMSWGATDRGDRAVVHDGSGRVGRQPIGTPKLLRRVMPQRWCRSACDALAGEIDSNQTLRHAVGIDLSRDSARHATPRLKCCGLALAGDLSKAKFEAFTSLCTSGVRRCARPPPRCAQVDPERQGRARPREGERSGRTAALTREQSVG